MKTNAKYAVMALALLAVITVGAFIYIGSGETPNEFSPAPVTDNQEKSETWSENENANPEVGEEPQTDVDNPHQQSEGTPDDEYPKVESESETEVNITFTDDTPEQEVDPNTPVGDDDVRQLPDTEKPSDPPTSPADTEEYTNPATPPETNTPSQGDRNDQGQVYDEAFGWITPSGTVGEVVDNDGDVDKQIGTMD